MEMMSREDMLELKKNRDELKKDNSFNDNTGQPSVYFTLLPIAHDQNKKKILCSCGNEAEFMVIGANAFIAKCNDCTA